MCSIEQSIVLSEAKNAQFTWCKCCKVYSLVFNNCCSSFTQDELKEFQSALSQLTDLDFRFQMLNQWFVILKTKNTRVGMCLTQEDTQILSEMIVKALTLQEAFDIVYN